MPRVMPADTLVVIERQSWQRPPVFDWLQEQGRVENEEMFRTFNNGIGMVLIVDNQDVEQTLALLQEQGEAPVVIGRIDNAQGEPRVALR